MPMKRSNAIMLMATAALCPISSAATARQPAKESAPMTLQQCVANEAMKSGFSGVVSVSRPSGARAYAFGVMGGKGSAKMLPNAQFNLGSASKMWTAVAVAQLVDAGKVSLDDGIGKHIRGLTPEAAAVTVRQLLTHSGGLGNFFTPDNLDLFKRARTLAELKPLIVSERPTFTPGSRSEYSNSGFLLLGLMIEQASGKDYGAYLQDHIFKPAAMTGSGVLPASPKLRALGMTNLPELDDMPDGPMMGPPPGAPPGPPPGGPMGPMMPPPGAQPGPPPGGPMGPMMPPPGPLRLSDEAALVGTSAGGSFSTPSDMQRFFAALLAGKLTSAKMREMLTTPQFELLPAKGPLPAVSYGMGFVLSNYKGRGSIGHNGGAPGVNVATAAFPKDQVTAVVMTNRDPLAADLMLRKVEAMLFDGSCR